MGLGGVARKGRCGLYGAPGMESRWALETGQGVGLYPTQNIKAGRVLKAQLWPNLVFKQ